MYSKKFSDKTTNRLDTWHKLGVFEVSVLGTTCGYFVGWKKMWDGGTQNIRAGLYFKTAEEATKFRDDIEGARQHDNKLVSHEQIA